MVFKAISGDVCDFDNSQIAALHDTLSTHEAILLHGPALSVSSGVNRGCVFCDAGPCDCGD